jgi:class 3 adenylate cyclase
MPEAGSRKRLLRPAAWPIAVKLSLVLLGVSLVPMGVTAALDVRLARAGAEQAELASLSRIAQSTAGRLDQLIDDTRRVVAQVAGETEVGAYLAAGPEASPELRASVEKTLANVVGGNGDLASAFLLDARGVGVISTRGEEVGRELAHREYYRRAIAGEAYVSEILTGSTTKKPGIYFSKRIDAPGKLGVGVAVVKLSGDVIARMVGGVRHGRGGAFLVDEWGVVVSHTDERLLYKSLAPLAPETQRLPELEQRFTSVGVDAIEPLGLDDLARRVASAREPTHVSFADVHGGDRQIAGLAPLASKRWHVVVYRPESELSAPLARVTQRSLANALLVGAAVTLLAIVLARTIVRPVRRLTDASRSILRGEFRAARVEAGSDDEIGALAEAFNTMAHGLEARERELEIFGRLVSPEVRETLLTGGLQLGGETRRAAVLFSDIRGFSTLAETMDPHAVVALLNEYLTAMTEATQAYSGYINNFIGDAIVVVFGAPIPQADAEVRAVRAAIAMRKALADLNVRRVSRGEAPLATGIGIAVGDMVAGQIGSPERMLYTVIGDAVNVAARLEALTKDYESKPILVTRRVADAIGDAVARLDPLGPIKLKGRAEPVEVVAVIT